MGDAVTDEGYVVVPPKSSGEKTPEQLGYYPEELEADKRMMLQDQPDPRSYGQIASDTWQNIKNAGESILPTALGGKGDFGFATGIYKGVTGAVDTVHKMQTGEIPLFDERGQPTEAAIAGGVNVAGVIPLPGHGVFPGTVGPNGAVPSIPERIARQRIKSAINRDKSTGKIRGVAPGIGPGGSPKVLPGMTPGQIDAVSAEGVPVSGYDLSGGPNVKKLVETSAGNSHNTGPVVGLQQDMAARSSSGKDYLANTVDNIAGKPLSTGDEFQTAVNNISDTNDPAYKRVMALPGNQSLFSPRLKSILEERPSITKIVHSLDESVRDTGAAPPAIYDKNGNLNIQPSNAPSLDYLNTVYKRIREEADKAYRAGDGDTGSKLKTAANDLRTELDNLAEKNPDGSSSYKTIRDDASELFGARNALDAGYKYLNNAAPLKLTKLLSDYDRFTPPQKDQFRTGLLARIKDDLLNPSKTNSISAYLDGSNPAMFDKISGIIGTDNATRLGNQVRMQRILNAGDAPNLAAVPHAAGSHGLGIAGVAGIGAATAIGLDAASELGPQIATVLSHPGTAADGAAGVAGVAYGLKKLISGAHNAYEASVAKSVLDAITTRDPAAIRRLDEYPPSALGYVLDRVGPKAARGAVIAATAQPLQIDIPGGDLVVVPPGKASGGRVGRKAGGRIQSNPISEEVKRVRTLLSHRTATMLSMPDDAVATALNIAKGQQ